MSPACRGLERQRASERAPRCRRLARGKSGREEARMAVRPTRPGQQSRLSWLLLALSLLLIHLIPTLADGWWMPGPGVSWQIQLTGEIDLNLDVDMYNIDLFDVSTSEIEELRNRDIVVICSFSAGTFEENRADSDAFASEWLGEAVVNGAAGERWLNVTAEGVLSLMGARMNLAVNKTCDGVNPSNLEVFLEDGAGFNITAGDQVTYNTWLAGQAHDRNLSVGLRNDWLQLADLAESFDWALSEDCLIQGECEGYKTNFVAAGKAVMDVEYLQFDLAFCDNVTASGLDIIVKDPSLDARRCSCQNPSTDIDCDELLVSSPTVTGGGSSSWVIATAVGASVFIILVAALVSWWRRRKSGGGGGGGSGHEPMSGFSSR